MKPYRDIVTGKILDRDPLNSKHWDSFEVECYFCDYYNRI